MMFFNVLKNNLKSRIMFKTPKSYIFFKGREEKHDLYNIHCRGGIPRLGQTDMR